MLAYHLDSRTPLIKHHGPPRHLIVEKNGLGHLWSTRLCASDTTAQPPPPTRHRRSVRPS